MSKDGLTATEAASRLRQYSPNELQEQEGKGLLRMFLEQFTQTMVLILIVAAVVSGLLGKGMETVAIGAIVILFGVLGFASEYRAKRAMASLKQMAVPVVRVRRDGRLQEISARDLVPGDIIVLETGNAVPADARLIESVNLCIQEAALTGESESVEKNTAAIPEGDLPLGDRRNMVYLGTAATYGRGTAVVVETAMRTELGKIAGLIQQVAPEPTPLQKQLDRVGKTLAVAGAVVSLLVLLLGALQGESVGEMFLTTVHRLAEPGELAESLPIRGDWSHVAFSKGAIDGRRCERLPGVEESGYRRGDGHYGNGCGEGGFGYGPAGRQFRHDRRRRT
jgi:Ca2+-transporting ATPase